MRFFENSNIVKAMSLMNSQIFESESDEVEYVWNWKFFKSLTFSQGHGLDEFSNFESESGQGYVFENCFFFEY